VGDVEGLPVNVVGAALVEGEAVTDGIADGWFDGDSDGGIPFSSMPKGNSSKSKEFGGPFKKIQ
jgi:hypothetical protein